MNIMQKINLHQQDFSKSEAKIGLYIEKNPKSIELYTITKIAELTNTSKSAVLRFCQKLNYQGYSEFRYDMINFLHADGENQSHEVDVVTKITQLYKQALDQFNKIDTKELDGLIEAIHTSDVLYSMGIYKSSLSAKKFQYNLIDCGKKVFFIEDIVSLNHIPYLLEKDSLFVIFSVSGISNQLLDFLRSNEYINCNSYLITSNARSSLSKHMKHTITLPSTKPDDHVKLDDHALYMVFIEYLTHLYLAKHHEES